MADDCAWEFQTHLARRRLATHALIAELATVRGALIALDEEEDDDIRPWSAPCLDDEDDD
jgi:hypothetical protein